MFPYSYWTTRTLWQIHKKVVRALEFAGTGTKTVSFGLFFSSGEMDFLWLDKMGISTTLWRLALYDEAFVAEAEWETLGKKHRDRLDHGIARGIFRTAKKALEAWLPVEREDFLERAIAPDGGAASADWLRVRVTLSPAQFENRYRGYLSAWHSNGLPWVSRSPRKAMERVFRTVIKRLEEGVSEKNADVPTIPESGSAVDPLGRPSKDCEILTAAAFAETFWSPGDLEILWLETPWRSPLSPFAETETLRLSLGVGWKERALALVPSFKYEFPEVFAKKSKAVGNKAAKPHSSAIFEWNRNLEQLTADGVAVILSKKSSRAVSAFFSILQMPGDRIRRSDIVYEIDPEANEWEQEDWDKAESAVRNSLNYANVKIRESSGVPDFFEFDKGYVWIRSGAGYREKG